MPTLYYVHDPMCSWCYAFAPTWRRIEAALPPTLNVRYVLGGLAPDSDEPMPAHLREYVRHTWRRIQSVVPGTQFNFEFWVQCTPRRSTYPACRAVLAAKHFDATLERPMIAAIQRAYYRQARNPSDSTTLCALAGDLGLDEQRFRGWIDSRECATLLERDLRLTRALGITGLPSLVLEEKSGYAAVPYSHTDCRVTLHALEHARNTA